MINNNNNNNNNNKALLKTLLKMKYDIEPTKVENTPLKSMTDEYYTGTRQGDSFYSDDVCCSAEYTPDKIETLQAQQLDILKSMLNEISDITNLMCQITTTLSRIDENTNQSPPAESEDSSCDAVHVGIDPYAHTNTTTIGLPSSSTTTELNIEEIQEIIKSSIPYTHLSGDLKVKY